MSISSQNIPAACQVLEFQAVILSGPGSRLYPLSNNEELPKPLIPIAGKPLISHILSWLEKEGIFSVILVVQRSAYIKIAHYIQKVYIGPLAIEIVVQEDEDDEGTIDSLLHIKPYLKTDFLLLPCDLIFSYPFKYIANMYRLERPSFLAVFHREAIAEGKKSTAENSDFVLLDETETKLLQMESMITLDDEIVIPFHILAKYPRLKSFTNLTDIHFYIINPSILSLLSQLRAHQLNSEEHEIMVSFREEFIPWLVSRQYFERNFNLDDEDLVILGDQEANTTEDSEQLSSDDRTAHHGSFKCVAFITNAQIPDLDTFNLPPMRVNTLASFMEANRHIVKLIPANLRISSSCEVGQKTQIGQDSFIKDNTVIGERSSIKRTIIGSSCRIGSGVKLNNCILLDSVVIENEAKIDNCIICSNVLVKEKAILKDCEIGQDFVVEANYMGQGETLVITKSIGYSSEHSRELNSDEEIDASSDDESKAVPNESSVGTSDVEEEMKNMHICY